MKIYFIDDDADTIETLMSLGDGHTNIFFVKYFPDDRSGKKTYEQGKNNNLVSCWKESLFTYIAEVVKDAQLKNISLVFFIDMNLDRPNENIFMRNIQEGNKPISILTVEEIINKADSVQRISICFYSVSKASNIHRNGFNKFLKTLDKQCKDKIHIDYVMYKRPSAKEYLNFLLEKHIKDNSNNKG